MKKRHPHDSVIQKIRYRRYLLQLKRRNTYYRPKKNNKVIGFNGDYILAPHSLSLYEVEDDATVFKETIHFINSLSESFCQKEIVVDFRETVRLTASAVLMIYATLEEAKSKGYLRSKILLSKNADVRKILIHNNINRLIENKEIKVNFDHSDDLPVITGVGNEHYEEIIDHIQNEVYKNKMSAETEHRYGDAVSETINNVGLHAYPEKIKEQKKWWLICHVISNQLYLAIYDIGVGIPNTVLKKDWFWASVKTIYPNEYNEIISHFPDLEESGFRAYIPVRLKFEDPKLLYLAMKGDVSGTKKSKHGQGSKSIRALVSENRKGKLWAFSGKGLYTINGSKEQNPEANSIQEPKIYSLPERVPGTLIQWNIELK